MQGVRSMRACFRPPLSAVSSVSDATLSVTNTCLEEATHRSSVREGVRNEGGVRPPSGSLVTSAIGFHVAALLHRSSPAVANRDDGRTCDTGATTSGLISEACRASRFCLRPKWGRAAARFEALDRPGGLTPPNRGRGNGEREVGSGVSVSACPLSNL